MEDEQLRVEAGDIPEIVECPFDRWAMAPTVRSLRQVNPDVSILTSYCTDRFITECL